MYMNLKPNKHKCIRDIKEHFLIFNKRFVSASFQDVKCYSPPPKILASPPNLIFAQVPPN